jgi:hypothetical protein
LITDVNGLEDVHNIYKLYDGAEGAGTLSVVLSNGDIDIPCDANGNALNGAFENANTEFIVYRGNDIVTNDLKKL